MNVGQIDKSQVKIMPNKLYRNSAQGRSITPTPSMLAESNSFLLKIQYRKWWGRDE